MRQRTISVALTTAVLLLGASLTFAVENKAAETGVASSTAQTSSKSSEAGKSAAKPKAAAKIKLVDINSAKKAELMKLPGIGEADADKIIAGRPYATKAWLLTHKVLSEESFQAVRGLVMAKQPYKDAGKNAALYAPKNKK